MTQLLQEEIIAIVREAAGYNSSNQPTYRSYNRGEKLSSNGELSTSPTSGRVHQVEVLVVIPVSWVTAANHTTANNPIKEEVTGILWIEDTIVDIRVLDEGHSRYSGYPRGIMRGYNHGYPYPSPYAVHVPYAVVIARSIGRIFFLSVFLFVAFFILWSCYWELERIWASSVIEEVDILQVEVLQKNSISTIHEGGRGIERCGEKTLISKDLEDLLEVDKAGRVTPTTI